MLVPGGVLTDFSSAMKYVQPGPRAFAKPIKSSVSLRYGIALVAAPVIKLNREVCFGTTPEGLEVGNGYAQGNEQFRRRNPFAAARVPAPYPAMPRGAGDGRRFCEDEHFVESESECVRGIGRRRGA